MPFIGKQPAVGAYSLMDSITTSATATYALTVSGVAYFPESPRHLIVSLNGVIQAPEDAYTVSGSNIIFDSALTVSDEINYILALGDVLDIGTPSDGTVGTAQMNYPLDNFSSTGIDDNATSTAITIDASQNVGVGTASPDGKLNVFSASAGSVSADADADELVLENSGNVGLSLLTTSTGESGIYFGNPGTNGQKDFHLKFYHESHATTANRRAFTFNTASTERMRIDASGRVTTPYQPAFQAYANSGGNEYFALGSNPSFNLITTNVGNHFDGTTFTAPIAGQYLFFYSILAGSAGDYGLIALHVNGSSPASTQNWSQHHVHFGNDQQNSSQQILTLSANDQVNLKIHPSYNHFYWNGQYSKFGGYLLG
jgi:hypothetical protein